MIGKPGTVVPGELQRTARLAVAIFDPISGTRRTVVTSGTEIQDRRVDIGPVPHKYPNILVHGVFSTKERQHLIPIEMLPRLWKYFAGIARNHCISLLAAGGTQNHCHLLIVLPSDMAFAKAIQVLKANSSRWIREHGIAFAWQEGYGAFSVSSSNKKRVIDYIEHQAEHHRTRTFESEFEVLIRRAGLRFDAVDAIGS